MVNVSTVTAVWNGFTGAPGYSLFRFEELDSGAKLNAAGAAVREFFTGFATNYLATGWTIGISPIVQHHEIGTGDLQGETAMGTQPPVVSGGGGVASYAGGSGAVVHWTTGATHGGRKVRGRTFLVPLLSVAYSSDGTVASHFIEAVQTHGNELIGDSTTTFGVYSRYWDNADPPNQTGGGFTPITGCVVPDRAAQLRTRRS